MAATLKRIFKRLVTVVIICCTCLGIWYIGIQLQRASYVNFDQFKNASEVESYFEQYWEPKKTTKQEVKDFMVSLGIQNCSDSDFFDGETFLKCAVLAPLPEKTPFDNTYRFVSLINDLYIIYFYDIYIYFEGDTLKKMNVIYWSSLPVGAL